MNQDPQVDPAHIAVAVEILGAIVAMAPGLDQQAQVVPADPTAVVQVRRARVGGEPPHVVVQFEVVEGVAEVERLAVPAEREDRRFGAVPGRSRPSSRLAATTTGYSGTTL